jgi:predicted ATPase
MSVVMSQTESFSPRLTTLGGLYLKPKGFQRPKLLLLLTYLVLEHGKSREHLRSLFWAGATDVSASLRVALAQIRNALPGSLEDSGSIVLTRIPCDAVDLQTALDASDWERAVELYMGAFLDGMMLSEFGNELEEWVLTTREYLAGRVVEAHLRLAEQALGHNDLENVKLHANQAHKLPGAPPPEEDTLTRLHNILNAIKSPNAAELRREAAELGLELSTTSTTATIAPAPTNLPAPTSSFIARETERRYLLETLKDPEARLVTVTGTGGMGKSRLALEVARQLHRENRFKDGVFVAFLEVIESVDAVVSELLRVLQVPIESGQDPQTKLLEHLKNTEILLMLDNLEHLIPFAGQLEQLLEACPKLKVLTTSRERLGLTAEWLLPLEGLPVPSDTEAKPDAPIGAVELFAARAKRQAPAFSLAAQHEYVLEICRLVEGLPLAIELAAALIRAITLSELIDAIRQHPDTLEGAINDPHKRHTGMRAVFEQSWSLLNPTQHHALMRLAVFKDGFSRVAALKVMDSNFTTLTSLVNKSLVHFQSSERYRLHPLITQYTLEKLEQQPEQASQAYIVHANFFLTWLEQNASAVRSERASEILAAFESDLENFRAAWQWLCANLDLSRFFRLQDLVLLFDARARFEEGIRLFEAALTALETGSVLEANRGDNLDFIRAMATLRINAAWLLQRIDKNLNALEHASKADMLLENSGEALLSMKVLNVLGTSCRNLGRYEEALSFFERGSKIAQESGSDFRVALAVSNIGNIRLVLGEYETALEDFHRAREIFLSLSDPMNVLANAESIAYLNLFCLKDNSLSVKSFILESIGHAQSFNADKHVFSLNIYLIFAHVFDRDYFKAKKLYEEIINIYPSEQNRINKFCLLSKALAEIGLGNLDLAENILLGNIKCCLLDNSISLSHQAMLYYASVLIQKKRFWDSANVIAYLLNQTQVTKWVNYEIQVLANLTEVQKLLPRVESKQLQLPWLT